MDYLKRIKWKIANRSGNGSVTRDVWISGEKRINMNLLNITIIHKMCTKINQTDLL